MKLTRHIECDTIRIRREHVHAATLISTAFLFILSGCGKEPVSIVQGTHAIPDIADNVKITGNLMTIDDGSSVTTITANDAGYLVDCGDFHVQLKNIADKDDSIVFGFTEWTGSDTLAVVIEWIGYRHQIETYTLNGQTLALEIVDDITGEQFDQLDQFLNDPAKSNSVMDNSDGYTMRTLIIKNWDEIVEEISDPDKRTEFGDMICPLAEACVASKCWFGGLLNTWCGACTSVVIACNIMDGLGWW